jgi:hypothetical protein
MNPIIVNFQLSCESKQAAAALIGAMEDMVNGEVLGEHFKRSLVSANANLMAASLRERKFDE